MSDIALSWKLGIDNVSTRTNLPKGAVVDAANVNINRTGGISRRSGRSTLLAQAGVHDVWTSEPRAQSFAIIGGSLCRVSVPWTSTVLQALTNDAPFSYCDLNGEVVCGSRYETFVIDSNSAVRRLGLEQPGAPRVTAGSGGLSAGTYGVAIAYLNGNEEGPLSAATFIELSNGQGLAVSIPSPVEALPTSVRVYRTHANGDVLHRAGSASTGTTYTLGIAALGRQVDTWGLDRMIPGDYLRYWKGMLWCVRGNVIFHSEPLRYGLYSPRFNFLQLPGIVNLFEPVEGGIFVGTRDGLFFLSGSGPKEFSVRKLGGKAPIPGTGTRAPASLLGGDDGDTGQYVALWLSPNGFVVGRGDGSILERQSKRISLSANSGAVTVHDHQVTAAVQ